MARSTTTKQPKPSAARAPEFQLRKDAKPGREAQTQVHVLKPGFVCDTEARGHSTPQGKSPLEIVVDASEGFVPLWAANTTLRWRFRDRSMNHFANPAAAKRAIRRLLGDALAAWGKASPVKFTENRDVWDFEIVMRRSDDCSASGCVLASAFFPDQGRHELTLYPQMFAQTREEQVDTLIHEIGHILGLRHFFAKIREQEWPAEIFGTHSKFSIMNYGQLSKLTDADKSDLKQLYQLVWSGSLTHINGTPIKLVKPFHTLTAALDGVFALSQPPAGLQPLKYE
jgi:hypothetical protein